MHLKGVYLPTDRRKESGILSALESSFDTHVATELERLSRTRWVPLLRHLYLEHLNIFCI